MARLSNPFSFTRRPVTVITSLVYLAVIVPLLVIHTGVPARPKSPTPERGVNLTEAWLDLQLLSGSYHPFNSRRNDDVHDWLLERIESIVAENQALATADHQAYIFSDTISNLTFSSPGSTTSPAGVSVYFEGTNIIVYVPGREDDSSEWWTDPNGQPASRNAVLVNAHYDSVSTGFGATDDGVGVISILQLLRYYTTPGNQPQNGLVLLLNNGEEDFLNGARVFSQHPMSQLVSTFLNLEGAGAGGRAALFRSTDAEVTQAYASSPHPFGSVISADGFHRGLVRSQTDYVVFNGILGLRGLDVAFIGPRSRYHTDQDDSRHTGQRALWHMLSAALATTKRLTAASLTTNLDPKNTPGHAGVWFDVLGRQFAVFWTHTLFAWSVTLLVAGPIFLLITLAFLYRVDKLYLWSGSWIYHIREDEEDAIVLYGWRGFSRFPLILLVSGAAPVALAYLLFKENEFIAHSSEWAVWSMMISSFVFVAWFLSRVADFSRPSSLTRAYGLSWLWLGWWAFLVVATVFEEQLHLAGVYFVLFYAASVWLATLLSYLELFSLPKKSKYSLAKYGGDFPSSRSRSGSRPGHTVPSSTEEHGDSVEEGGAEEEEEEEPATERSSLLRSRGRSTFKNYGPPPEEQRSTSKSKDEEKGHNEEQEWSQSQWTSLWVAQLLVLVPVNLILLGQIGLSMVTALHQTGQDGSSMFTVYIGISVLTILLFSPIVPILHRFTWHVPMFLFLVLIGTLIYNLVAFPFSPQNRLKLFFQQEVDLDNGTNTASLLGVPPYVQDAIEMLPSSAGQKLACVSVESFSHRQKCSWPGLPPNVADPFSRLPPEARYPGWLNFNVTRLNASIHENEARFVLYGKNTRACKIVFDSPIAGFRVLGQAPVDQKFPPIPEAGSNEIRLWSRTWGCAWTVDVSWDTAGGSDGMSGKVVCLWSDINRGGVIPAFDEAWHYAPPWVAISKAADGLVEGFKRFAV